MFLNYFDVLISKIFFKKIKKYYFNIFLSEKYFQSSNSLLSYHLKLQPIKKYILT